jgi:hypothetical protein
MPYIIVVPRHDVDVPEIEYTAPTGEDVKYIMSPVPVDSREKAEQYRVAWAGMERVNVNETKVIELHMPEELYLTLRKNQDTFIKKKIVDKILAVNTKYSYNKVGAAASLLAQGQRSPDSKLSKTPTELLAKISSLFATGTKDFEEKASNEIDAINRQKQEQQQMQANDKTMGKDQKTLR